MPLVLLIVRSYFPENIKCVIILLIELIWRHIRFSHKLIFTTSNIAVSRYTILDNCFKSQKLQGVLYVFNACKSDNHYRDHFCTNDSH
jgi:hypothetical protein